MPEQDSLFETSIADELRMVGKFVAEERGKREHMLDRQPERSHYWQGRIAQCDVVLAKISSLIERTS